MAAMTLTGEDVVRLAPDARPAIRLGRELARDRRLGLPFEQAWLDDPTLAVAGLQSEEAADWLSVFDQTQEMWRRAFERQPLAGALSRDLIAA